MYLVIFSEFQALSYGSILDHIRDYGRDYRIRSYVFMSRKPLKLFFLRVRYCTFCFCDAFRVKKSFISKRAGKQAKYCSLKERHSSCTQDPLCSRRLHFTCYVDTQNRKCKQTSQGFVQRKRSSNLTGLPAKKKGRNYITFHGNLCWQSNSTAIRHIVGSKRVITAWEIFAWKKGFA